MGYFFNGGATISNESYLRVLFLLPGSFDTRPIVASANIIAQAIYGIGPNAVQSENLRVPVPPSGQVSSFPGRVTVAVNAASLPSTFQLVVLLQTVLSGQTNGFNAFSWNANLGNTLNVRLVAPDGLTLTAAGGLGGLPIATADVPEPASFLLAAAGSGLIVFFRRHSK